MPDLGNGHAGLFYNYNIMFGDGNMDLYVLIHEATHCLDFGATDMSPISESSLWQDAYAQDSAAPTEYATSNWIEGFAEVGPLSFYDKYVEGGLAAIQPSISQVSYTHLSHVHGPCALLRKPRVIALTPRCRSRTSSTSSASSSTAPSR